MKNQIILTASLFTILTAVQPQWALADDSSTSRIQADEEAAPRLRDFPAFLNAQIGGSSFEFSGEDSKGANERLSSALTFEFGQASRRLETGLLLLRTSATIRQNNQESNINSSYLAIPMFAKLRLMALKAQSWYLKLGAMTAFEVSSSQNEATNNIDIFTVLGVSGRFTFNRKVDLIVDATYNRGLVDALRGSYKGNNRMQGIVVMAGMSFSI